MKTLITWGLFLFLWSGLFGQISNPFEIEHRLNEKRQSSQNPFEIGSSTDSTSNALVAPITLDSLEYNSASIGDNPFEVDHIPLRTSPLQESSAVQPINKRRAAKKSPGLITGYDGGLLVFLISVISLILIAIVANTRRSLFSKIFRSFFNDNMMKLTKREENSGLNGAFIILYVNFILNAGIFVFLAASLLSATQLPWWLSIIGIAALYAGRHFFLWLFSFVFPIDREVGQYSFVIAVFNLLIGLTLIPINLIVAYTTPSIAIVALYSGIGILGFVLIIRYSKGIILGLIASRGKLFNFLLYLCTFEIVPILVLFKLSRNLGTFL